MPGAKASLVLLPILGCLVTSKTQASAQVILEGEQSLTTVDVVGNRIDISGGHSSADNTNQFHNFEQFDITSEQTANFVTSSDVHNVIGTINSAQASTIDGTLQVSGSEANLYLMNPAGILFGPNAQLNLSGGFTATTATGIGFENSRLTNNNHNYELLTGDPTTFYFENAHAGAVVNLGELGVEPEQSLTLLGGTVANAGNLSAPSGTVTIAAVEGENIVRIQQDQQLLSLELDAATVIPQTDRHGDIGSTETSTPPTISEMLTGGAITHANDLIINSDGSVSLGIAHLGKANHSIDERGGRAIATGNITTLGTSTDTVGGNINVLGSHVELANATLDASGATGGGLIRVGGDYQGAGDLFNAQSTTVDELSLFNVSALENGDGGVAIAWADNQTQFYGQVQGRGGQHGGDGGFVEVSGKEHLIFDGLADLRASQGSLGTLFLDPENIFITNSGSSQTIGNDDYIPQATLEAQLANIDLAATNNIVVEDLLDDELSLTTGGFARFIADSDASGMGAFIMQDINDVIRGEQKDITISGAGIHLGIIDTSTDQHNNGGTLGIHGGDVTLNSSQAVTAEQIATYGELISPAHHSGDGGNVNISVQAGDINIGNSILTYSEVIFGSESGSAGDISLRTNNGNIILGDRAISSDSILNASSKTAQDDTGNGGNIELIAGNGTLEILGDIETASRAGTESAGRAGNVRLEANNGISTGAILANSQADNGDDAERGGLVMITAHNSDVSIGQIDTSSSATEDNSRNGGSVEIQRANNVDIGGINTASSTEENAGRGGNVFITATGEINLPGIINTSSIATDEDTQDAGFINLTADRIIVNTLDTRTQDTDDNAGNAGEISLSGASLVEAGNILATSSTDSSVAGNNGNIFITSDQIDLTGGPNSIGGKEIWLSPFNSFRDINLGGTATGNALNLDATDLATVDNSSRNIRVGLLSGIGTGIITIDQSVADTANSRPTIRVSGGEQLVGPTPSDPSLATNFLLNGAGTGRIVDADIRFSNIPNLMGGDGQDIFRLAPGSNVNDFESLSGGGGSDRLSYAALATRTNINLSELDLSEFETVVGSSLGTTLIGTNQNNQWTISNINGVETVSINGLGFENVDEVIGGNLDDVFAFVDGVVLNGSIAGGDGYDQLDYDRYNATVEANLGAQTSTGFTDGYSNIENINGSRTMNDLLQVTPNDDIVQMVDDVSGRIEGLIEFSHFETISGLVGRDTIVGSDRPTNDWTLNGLNSGLLNDVRFLNFENIEGGSEIDQFFVLDNGQLTGNLTDSLEATNQLNYSSYSNPIRIDFSERTATGIGGNITGINGIIGTQSADDIALGTAGDDSFLILGDQLSILNNEIMLVAIDTINGGAGENTFTIDEMSQAPVIEIIGGSDLGSGLSNNRILSHGLDTLWQIDSRNAGRLTQRSSNFTSFRDIQHLEHINPDNRENTGEMTVFFTLPEAQVSGSINSGNSNLTLTGNEINIGESNHAGDHQNGLITGNRELTIIPELNTISIELGGVDRELADVLSLSAGEIAAIQPGFSQINIGTSELTGEIRTLGDVDFSDAVMLRSQGNIDTTAGEFSTASGSLSLISELGAVNTGSVNNQDTDIIISGNNNINIDAAFSSGGSGISITSQTGSVTVANTLNTSNRSQVGRDISISAQTNIEIYGDIDTSGLARGGQVTLTSESGNLITQGITTSTGTDANDASGRVSLSSLGSIEVEFIDATGTASNTIDPLISIDTQDSFRTTGRLPNSNASISTTGPEQRNSSLGSIEIMYGEANQPNTNYFINTAGSITTTDNTLSVENSSSNFSEGNITITNRGAQLLRPELDTPRVDVPSNEEPRQENSRESITNSETVLANMLSNLAESEFNNLEMRLGLTMEEKQELFTALNTSLNREFSQYFGLDEDQQSSGTLIKAQERLQSIENSTQTTPALVYVYFMPDAAPETRLNRASERHPSDDDQLEVMLVTQTGEPIVHRQWGISRAQVEAVGEEFRQHAVNQISSTSQYLNPAQTLYNWIMQPLATELEQRNIQSLGFILDTGLRTIPLAAMHDGDQYLIENYSVGLLSSWGLTDFSSQQTHSSSLQDASVLAMGASEFEQQPDLPAVGAEIQLVTNNMQQGEAFLNEAFVLETLQTELQSNEHDVVHLATHANFAAGDLDNSYIQLWDEQLSLSNMDALQLSDADIQLMILSACNTAFGDANSEYGFAGFAVNSGTPSVMASLWPVSDEGTLGFMSQFYEELRQAPIKAEALRAAQVQLLSGNIRIGNGTLYGADDEAIAHLPTLAESGHWDFSHPFYWAAFTMIGNPW